MLKQAWVNGPQPTDFEHHASCDGSDHSDCRKFFSISGVKAHVHGETEDDVAEIMKVVKPLAEKHGWGWKHANNFVFDNLRAYAPEQANKAVTIYFPRRETWRDEMEELHTGLKDYAAKKPNDGSTHLNGDEMRSNVVGTRWELSTVPQGNITDAREYERLYKPAYKSVTAEYDVRNMNWERANQPAIINPMTQNPYFRPNIPRDKRICKGVGKYNLPCMGLAKLNGYCPAHQSQASEKEPVTSSAYKSISRVIIAMPFKPTRDYYRTDWDELPDKVYHVAPRSAREDILKNGLNPKGKTWNFAGPNAQWSGDHYTDEKSLERGFHYRPEGVYVNPPGDAAIHTKEFIEEKRDGEPHDIWEIDTKSLREHQNKPEHKTDLLRDPEIMQSWYETDKKETEEAGYKYDQTPHEAFDNLKHWDGEDGESDARAWVFEKVHPKHIRRVKPYELKHPDTWMDEDFEDHMDDHPEEYQDDERVASSQEHIVRDKPPPRRPEEPDDNDVFETAVEKSHETRERLKEIMDRKSYRSVTAEGSNPHTVEEGIRRGDEWTDHLPNEYGREFFDGPRQYNDQVDGKYICQCGFSTDNEPRPEDNGQPVCNYCRAVGHLTGQEYGDQGPGELHSGEESFKDQYKNWWKQKTQKTPKAAGKYGAVKPKLDCCSPYTRPYPSGFAWTHSRWCEGPNRNQKVTTEEHASIKEQLKASDGTSNTEAPAPAMTPLQHWNRFSGDAEHFKDCDICQYVEGNLDRDD